MIETPRLILREFTMDDLSALHTIFSDPIGMSFYPAPFTIEQTTNWIERSMKEFGEGRIGRYAVILKETGALIGCAGFAQLEVNGEKETDLGYLFDRSHWGKGYATEAARACLEEAKSRGLWSRIIIQMATEHTRSRMVAERLGARLEKRFIHPRNRMKLTNLFVIELS